MRIEHAERQGAAPAASTGPLAGVRVLDFTRILSGPYCTLLLAEMGADVVKVERSDRGDDTRSWGPPFLDEAGQISTYFAAMNRGKRSLAVDLRAPTATALIARLACEADVVIENFRPGVGSSLGLDWESLSTQSPRIVLCSISGFGASGEYADLPATEIVVEGMSGIMEITGPVDGAPVRFGIAMVDIATGLTAAAQIAASLLMVRQTGTGRHVRCALYSTALAVLSTLITSYAATGDEPRRWGSHHPTVVPYGGFATADGYLITGVINDASWPAFCEALGLHDLAARPALMTNAGRVAGREHVNSAIERATRERETDYWLTQFRSRGLLAAPVRRVSDAAAELAAGQSGALTTLEGFPGIVLPTLSGEELSGPPPAVPRLGEHSADVLRDLLDMDENEIEQLLAAGVIADRSVQLTSL
jgi:crotonobetainyl-CoA:carnitine CoA-transferase CaiB-like acyl-CoA transferase